MNREQRKRWGLILAGGDGVRLRPLTRVICGDDRPKQFCALYGGLTLLEHARLRAERCIAASQIVFSLTRAHEEFYRKTLSNGGSRCVVQPQNRGTLPAILSSLLTIAHQNPEAQVAVLPSDHYFSDESIFAESVEQAFDLTRHKPDCVVLVGAQPRGPEVEYGWIRVGDPVYSRRDAFLVDGFHEKPPEDIAQLLWEQGSLWNTFVMVGKVLAFLELVCSAQPGLLNVFRQCPSLWAPREQVTLEDSLYDRLIPRDFSREVLARETNRLVVQRLGPVVWSDLGDCDRATSTLEGGMKPEWAANWRAAKRSVEFVASAVA